MGERTKVDEMRIWGLSGCSAFRRSIACIHQLSPIRLLRVHALDVGEENVRSVSLVCTLLHGTQLHISPIPSHIESAQRHPSLPSALRPLRLCIAAVEPAQDPKA